jgi:tRNA pseudouridine55 synthase
MSEQKKRRWLRVDGVLLLDKSSGMTSNDALQKARRLFSAAKGGHTGTLDPMASGLLPLCFGEATKFANDLLDADKTYLAELKLGQRTDTADADGEIIAERPVTVGEAELLAVLPRFTGTIEQVPPMYSALKRDGVPLYKLARQGVEVERAARQVTIHSIEVTRVALPFIELRVACSKGTYIRTLAEDIGEALACGAHLTALRRERVGGLDVGDALTLEQIAEIAEDQRNARLQAPDALLASLPRVDLDGDSAIRFRNGNAVAIALPNGERFRVYVDAILVGVARRDDEGRLQPQRLISLPV